MTSSLRYSNLFDPARWGGLATSQVTQQLDHDRGGAAQGAQVAHRGAKECLLRVQQPDSDRRGSHRQGELQRTPPALFPLLLPACDFLLILRGANKAAKTLVLDSQPRLTLDQPLSL